MSNTPRAAARQARLVARSATISRARAPHAGVPPNCCGLAYGLGMPARKLPTPRDAATARRILLDGLARDADIFVLVNEIAPLHPRNSRWRWRGSGSGSCPSAHSADGRTTSSSSPSWPPPRCAAEPSPISWTRSPGGKPTTSGNLPCSQRSPASVPPPTGPVRPCARHASSWPSTRATQRHNYHFRRAIDRQPRVRGHPPGAATVRDLPDSSRPAGGERSRTG